MDDFLVVTTPTVPGYRITEVFGIITGLAPRTRGVGGVLKVPSNPLWGGRDLRFYF